MPERLPAIRGGCVPVPIGAMAPDIFKDATVTANEETIAVEQRIRLGDFSSAGTLRVTLDTRRLVNVYEFLALPVDKVMYGDDPFRKDAAARSVIVGWENGKPAHGYVQKNFFPYNEPSQPLDRPSAQTLAMGKLARLEVTVTWDDDSVKEMDLDSQLHEELGESIYDYSTGEYSEEYWRLYKERLSKLSLEHTDPRAATQPLALEINGRIFASIPDQESVMMQQGLFAVAPYEGFVSPEMPENFDKLDPESPDLNEFWGSPLLVPFRLDVLRGLRLAFPQVRQLDQSRRINTQDVLELIQPPTEQVPIDNPVKYNELHE